MSDHVMASGAVNLNGATLQLSLLDTGNAIQSGDVFFLLISGSGTVFGGSNLLSYDGTLLTNGATFFDSSTGFEFKIDYDSNFALGTFGNGSGNDIALSVVPEPSTWAAMLMGCVGLLIFRRRFR